MQQILKIIQISANQEKAHQRQKKNYLKRKSKGVRTFNFKIGQQVLKRNMRNVNRIGGKLDLKWQGPYR